MWVAIAEFPLQQAVEAAEAFEAAKAAHGPENVRFVHNPKGGPREWVVSINEPLPEAGWLGVR